ncbi:hypothetical protein OU789_09630 [Halocynthiibacter sp. C4]|uniref:hypothetical protein n=1 Tax=Halocynthiibacter sp. C4 TaxID=2992758 RepID=UPI00237A8C86|nr:hypothetical protein [Halocynthiibacter sp. C4]MDE0590183.1 hypothetical protein [Halocynthiibacter sp. C4]
MKRLSFRRAKQQEFLKTISTLIKHGAEWEDIFLKLATLQASLLKKITRLSVTLSVCYLALYSFQSDTSATLSILSVKVIVPQAFIAVVASVTFWATIQYFQVYLMILSIRNSYLSRHGYTNFYPQMFASLEGHEDMALIVPPVAPSFLQYKYKLPQVAIILQLTIYSLMLAPITFLFVFLVQVQIEILTHPNASWMEYAVSGYGITLLAYTAVMAIIFNMPFRCKKNTHHIRWGFLSAIHRPNLPPRAFDWLDDENRPSNQEL